MVQTSGYSVGHPLTLPNIRLIGEVYDPEMKAYFATVTKAGKFKWELDVAASRAGRKWTPEKSVALEEEAVRQNEDVFWHAEPVGEGGLGFVRKDLTP